MFPSSPISPTSPIMYSMSLTDHYAGQLAALIQRANEAKSPDSGYSTMIPKTPVQLQQQMESYGGGYFFDPKKKRLISALVLSKLGDYNGIPVCELGSVVTHPFYQKQGYAKQLMQIFCTSSLPEDGIVVIVGTSAEVNTMYQRYFSDSFPCVSRDLLKFMHPALFDCINTPPLGPRDCIFIDKKHASMLGLSC